MKILKGDKVQILIGKDKGRQAVVKASFPKKQTVTVDGLNTFKKHLKPQNGQKGGIIEKERPLAISKVMLVCPECHKPARVGYQIDAGGNKTRVCKKCHAVLVTNKK